LEDAATLEWYAGAAHRFARSREGARAIVEMEFQIKHRARIAARGATVGVSLASAVHAVIAHDAGNP
jgi:hypothetical protein